MIEALISLIENLASSPQLLVILLLEGYRVFVSSRHARAKPSTVRMAPMHKYEFWLTALRYILNAAPSIGLTISIFFVRF